MSGQSIMDRVVAAKHSIAGQGLAKSVCKATTEEVMGPKKKHLDYLLQCTNEPNVSIPQLADLLIERTQHHNWVVVYKSLITIHNLMNYGNERFSQYLASNNCTFNLGGFLDKSGVQGYDMSTFIRRYAKYMNEKAYSYRNMAFDFCKVKRGKDDGMLRTMNTDKLLKTLPILQQQLDGLLEFDCSHNELTNGVINACFLLLFKDLIRLFACYNDGIINLLEKYFDMNKKQCKEALDLYKKFLVRMDKVSEFLKVAENVGIDKGDIPDLAKAPSSLLDALEQHLASLEGKKGAVTTPTSKPSDFATAVNSFASSAPEVSVSDEEMNKLIEEENIRMQQLKEKRLKEVSPATSPQGPPPPSSSNPFNTVNQTKSSPPVDLFGSPTKTNDSSAIKPSDDLLALNSNPFVEQAQRVNEIQHAPNDAFPSSATTNGGTFTSDADFDRVFNNAPGNQSSAVLDGNTNTTMAATAPISTLAPGFDAFGEILKPGGNASTTAPKQQDAPKLIQKDLDSSLAQLAGNLNMRGSDSQVKKTDHQWNPKGENKKTGGANWQTPALTAAMTFSGGYQQQPPANAPMMGYGTQNYNMPQQPGYNMGMQQQQRPMAPGMGMAPGIGMAPGMAMPPANNPFMAPQGNQFGMQQPARFPQQRPPATQANDPFGAL